MVVYDTLEGQVDNRTWFHYDLRNDVLYLCLTEHRRSPSFSDEQEDGTFVVRNQETDEPVGLTIVGWWKDHNQGPLPDSLEEIALAIEPWASKIPAESLT